ncbi:MAG TPA: hypothetical protein PKX48_06740 [Planctomycetota bacterium]|jgi:cytochrome oxidase Cu insertion factor (SCO1/SenC/PrrC family)|nr:hypothetical protein [Planctomycetota bacterium]OQC21269.1 MAG: hypothetical protein BWX69_01000 [Planctomycetes bacterium ADurb.Bin069]NMD35924.1 hypothetical protein [Planctomycetota bacterium]HNR99200.1 hypothetical protein [Planctomycetota bacterium]HNU25273.1 hypothetical protein [Planctomycetota bacterium]
MLLRCLSATALGMFAFAAGETKDVQSSVKVGAQAKDFTLRASDGSTFTLSSLRGEKIAVIGVGNPFG